MTDGRTGVYPRWNADVVLFVFINQPLIHACVCFAAFANALPHMHASYM